MGERREARLSAAATAAGYLYASGRLRNKQGLREKENQPKFTRQPVKVEYRKQAPKK